MREYGVEDYTQMNGLWGSGESLAKLEFPRIWNWPRQD